MQNILLKMEEVRCSLHSFEHFFCVLLPNSPRQLQGKCCSLCWLKCVFTPNEGMGDVWMLGGGGKRHILNHAERLFSHHSGGDFHQAKNPSQLVSLPHLWVDVAQWGEGTPTALDFDFVLKLLDQWLTPGPPGPLLFPITCFYDSALKMIESQTPFM